MERASTAEVSPLRANARDLDGHGEQQEQAGEQGQEVARPAADAAEQAGRPGRSGGGRRGAPLPGFPHAVAHLLHAFVHGLGVQPLRVILDPHLGGGEVHAAEEHAVQSSHALLELSRAVRAVHALNDELTVLVTLLDEGAGRARLALDFGQGDEVSIVVQAQPGDSAGAIDVRLGDAALLAQAGLELLDTALAFAVLWQEHVKFQF